MMAYLQGVAYYQIDKSNQIKARYVLRNNEARSMGGHPNSLCRFFSMTVNNANKIIYTVLNERKHQQDENENDCLK